MQSGNGGAPKIGVIFGFKQLYDQTLLRLHPQLGLPASHMGWCAYGPQSSIFPHPSEIWPQSTGGELGSPGPPGFAHVTGTHPPDELELLLLELDAAEEELDELLPVEDEEELVDVPPPPEEELAAPPPDDEELVAPPCPALPPLPVDEELEPPLPEPPPPDSIVTPSGELPELNSPPPHAKSPTTKTTRKAPFFMQSRMNCSLGLFQRKEPTRCVMMRAVFFDAS